MHIISLKFLGFVIFGFFEFLHPGADLLAISDPKQFNLHKTFSSRAMEVSSVYRHSVGSLYRGCNYNVAITLCVSGIVYYMKGSGLLMTTLYKENGINWALYETKVHEINSILSLYDIQILQFQRMIQQLQEVCEVGFCNP